MRGEAKVIQCLRPRPLLTRPRQGRTSIGVIFKSPYPDVALPDVPLHEFVLRRAAALGDKPALVDAASGRSLTYAALAAGVARVAAGLAARGFRPGDRSEERRVGKEC